MAHILDDKSQHCVPFILQRLELHQHGSSKKRPFFIGLQGVQGAGKTTLVETLQSVLASSPYHLKSLVLSIDDLYLPHSRQIALAEANPDNPLIQHRGQPSTHDVKLGEEVFSAIEQVRTVKVPSYDKSAFNGAGDRRPESEWQVIDHHVDVVIFEGWCVGFRALSEHDLQQTWQTAQKASQGASYRGQLGMHKLSDINFINDALKAYDVFTNRFSCFIQIDAEDPLFVYDWRLQQEAALRQARGSGMTNEQVVKFVDGYYPAYELYTQVLREGIFDEPGKQLRLVIDKQRRVREVLEL